MTRSRKAVGLLAGMVSLLTGLVALTIAPAPAAADGVSARANYTLIASQATRRCLDSNANGAVYTLPCQGSLNQLWRRDYHTRQGEDSFYMYKNLGTGRCLASNTNQDVFTVPCPGGEPSNQLRWRSEGAGLVVTYDWKRALDSDNGGWTYTRPKQFGNRYQEWFLV